MDLYTVLPAMFIFLAWVMSVALHEFGHAIVAYKGGDESVKYRGYLTLNPFRYTNPFLTFILPIIILIIGGIPLPGGSVIIMDKALKSRWWRTAVSLAGPGMTFLVILFCALLYHISFITLGPRNPIVPSLAFLTSIEVAVFFLNLLPVPPLDGYRAIEPWLPHNIVAAIRPMSFYGIFLIFILFRNDSINAAFWNLVYNVISILHVNQYLAYLGQKLFMFWQHTG